MAGERKQNIKSASSYSKLGARKKKKYKSKSIESKKKE
jgi:hypothetical protein